jgi:lipoyl-dependent peroxiredoxin
MAMAIRAASASWQGDLKSGTGHMRFGSGAFEGAYSFASRFADGKGTNPEELIGAAHAGCFAMATAGALGRAGHAPKRLDVAASVHLEQTAGGPRINRIDLSLEGDVPGIDAKRFSEIAEEAKRTCPVSVALAGVDIRLTASLRS